jgi:hypothetical protein
MEINRKLFDSQRRPRFGTANPERMSLAFWEWMIRGDDAPSTEDEGVLGKFGLMMRNGILKSGYGPWRARDKFKVSSERTDGPIWTFDRMGASRTAIPDGRVVCVGGEHEDHYDPDFNIYNDVVVFGPDDRIDIYGYPKDVFPPTDFHTATLLGQRVVVVGRLGYPDDRRAGTTPVFALDLTTYRMTEIEAPGESPGWIFEHEAEIDLCGAIAIRGGKVFEEVAGSHRVRRNFDDFVLNLHAGSWERLTDRKWRQFSIRTEDRKFFMHGSRSDFESIRCGDTRIDPAAFDSQVFFTFDAILPTGIGYERETDDDWKGVRIVVDGIPVSIRLEGGEIEIIVEGKMTEELSQRLAEDLRSNLEATTGCRCVLDPPS